MSDKRMSDERLAEKLKLIENSEAMLPLLKTEVSGKIWQVIHDLVIGSKQNLEALRAERAQVEELERKHSELVDGLKWLVFRWDEPGEWADDTWHHGNMATLTECAATLRALLEQEVGDE